MSQDSIFFRGIRTHPDRFYIIHYSCQSLFDDNEQLSPRVTSIVVSHYATNQTVSFSAHAIAEELGIARDAVVAEFDAVETKLLESFFAFARDRKDKFWVHWNMRNIIYGFEHIEHRYRTLKKSEPPSIPVERRINLNDMLSERYGSAYVPDPRMLHLMELNEGRHRDFLTGAEEVEAFKGGEFVRMHKSTLCKVGFFQNVIDRTLQGRLKTRSRSFLVFADRVFDSRLSRSVGLASSAVGILIPSGALLFWVISLF